MNKILKILIYADILMISAFGLLAPIFALFLSNNIKGGTIAAAGVASAIYLLTKCLFQLLIARFNDAEPGNKREVMTTFIGYLMLSFIPLTAVLLMAFSNPEPIVNPVVEKVQSLTQQITDPNLFPDNITSLNNPAIQKKGITIKGKVIDGSTSKPIKGVNIIIQGTTTGTTSDKDGAFEIKSDNPNVFLVFSHIGYTTSVNEFNSDTKSVVIKMNIGTHDLSAVIVKTDGNTQALDIKPYPYVLVDGVAVDEETFKALDPNKIESVNILKDESATAVYGEKGKNGVILVITKKENSKEESRVTGNQKSDNSAVFTVVEEMPSFPGGESERARFFSNNLRIPAENIEGTVYVSFIVKADGSVTNAKILRGLGKSYDEEVLRVINLMPKWFPGTQNGEAVDVLFNLPVKFSKN